MRRDRAIPLVVSLVAVFVVGLSSWAIYTSEGAQKAREREARLAEARAQGPGEPSRVVDVEVVTAERRSAQEVVELSGVLEALRATWVAAEIAGRVVDVPAVEHAPVDAGDVLVRLDEALPRAELIRAEAAHRLAKAELERQRRLGDRSVASQAELERAEAEERRSYAALLEARTRLGHATVRAPFDGVVNRLDPDLGAYVQPGTRIAEVLDVATLEVSVVVSDRQVGAVRPGDAARVRIDPLGNAVREARVARVARAPEEGTRRYPIVVELPNPDGRLLPGMLVYVELDVGESESLRVPMGAVRREFELDYVFTIDAGPEGLPVARRRRVSTRPVPFRPDWVEVVEGMEDGERVVVRGVERLRDGAPVRIAERG